MARVLLLIPPGPQPLATPYLGQQYLVVSLLTAGHQVRVLPLEAVGGAALVDQLEDHVRAAPTDIVGVTLFTDTVRAAYDLARRLRSAGPLLVAGGPHATACPDEPLRHGFAVSVVGEAEHALADVATAVDRGQIGAGAPAGIWPNGGPAAVDPDGLPFAHTSQTVYGPVWPAPGGPFHPGHLMASRGCPARCTFCANQVTGRRFHPRRPQRVVAEMADLCQRFGVRHFQFLDDAFAARRSHTSALCTAIAAHPVLKGCTWSCITPANRLQPADLERLWTAGCRAVNFGVESGDPQILRQIGKGLSRNHVVHVVRAAKAIGLHVVVNVMFGFPGEDQTALDRTLAFMHHLAPHVDFFNQRGVVIPYPGTPLYERWHREYGFAQWWLRPGPAEGPRPDLRALWAEAEDDPVLERDFFRYSSSVRQQIRACLRFKADHNRATLQRLGSQIST